MRGKRKRNKGRKCNCRIVHEDEQYFTTAHIYLYTYKQAFCMPKNAQGKKYRNCIGLFFPLRYYFLFIWGCFVHRKEKRKQVFCFVFLFVFHFYYQNLAIIEATVHQPTLKQRCIRGAQNITASSRLIFTIFKTPPSSPGVSFLHALCGIK